MCVTRYMSQAVFGVVVLKAQMPTGKKVHARAQSSRCWRAHRLNRPHSVKCIDAKVLLTLASALRTRVYFCSCGPPPRAHCPRARLHFARSSTARVRNQMSATGAPHVRAHLTITYTEDCITVTSYPLTAPLRLVCK